MMPIHKLCKQILSRMVVSGSETTNVSQTKLLERDAKLRQRRGKQDDDLDSFSQLCRL